MAGTILVDPFLQFFDNNGSPLALGTVSTFAAGTSTPLATCSDVDLLVDNPVVITLNSAGRPAVSGVIVAMFLQAKAYKLILKTSAGVTIDTRDNVVAYQGASGTSTDITGTFGATVTAGQAVYLSNGSGALNAGQWYKADTTLSYASTDALIGFAVSAVTAGATGQIRILGSMDGLSGMTAGLSYYLSGTAGAITSTAPTLRRFVGVAMSTTQLLIVPSPPAPVDTFPLSVCEGRLTLTTATPVTIADVTAATSIFFTPYRGNRITLFDGSVWNTRTFSEITIALGTLSSGKPYDLFAYDNNGAVAFDAPLAWTNGTTRATALVLQDGVLSKTGALTRRYIGTFYTTATTTTEDSAAKRFLWNYYNRVPRMLLKQETTASWTYTTATWRQVRAQAANQVEFVIGAADVLVDFDVSAIAATTSASTGFGTAVGLDSTSVPVATQMGGGTSPSATGTGTQVWGTAKVYPAVGYHFAAWLEVSAGFGTQTWYGLNASAPSSTGVTGVNPGLTGWLLG